MSNPLADATIAAIANRGARDDRENTLAGVAGPWDYRAGASGTPDLSTAIRVRSMTCFSAAGGSVTINGGNSIPIPAGVVFYLPLDALLSAPTIVFTSTDTYFVDFVTQ